MTSDFSETRHSLLASSRIPKIVRSLHEEERGVIYFFLALASLGLDCLIWTFYHPFSWSELLTSLAIGAGLVLSARFPTAGSLSVIAASCFAIYSPFTVYGLLVTPYLSVVAIAELISRERFLLASFAGIVLIISYLQNPTMRSPWAYAMSILLQAAIAISLGMAMLAHNREVDRLKHESAVAMERASMQLALTLHDTVITDLTKALVSLRILQKKADAFSAGSLDSVEAPITEAIANLRQTVRIVEKPAEAAPPSVFDVLEEARQRLRMRGIRLVTELPDEYVFVHQFDRTRYRFVAIFLQEALINCLKYAPEYSIVTVSSEIAGSQVEVAVRSVLSGAVIQHSDEGLSSGTGIPSLGIRARSLGGDVTAGAIPGFWLISLLLPSDSSEAGAYQ